MLYCSISTDFRRFLRDDNFFDFNIGVISCFIRFKLTRGWRKYLNQNEGEGGIENEVWEGVCVWRGTQWGILGGHGV